VGAGMTSIESMIFPETSNYESFLDSRLWIMDKSLQLEYRKNPTMSSSSKRIKFKSGNDNNQDWKNFSVI
jgi:hypothetical protein